MQKKKKKKKKKQRTHWNPTVKNNLCNGETQNLPKAWKAEEIFIYLIQRKKKKKKTC